MLRALRLEHFRSFVDTGRVELADLNVFIGPNSAGKSSLMTVIELALQIGIDMGSSTGPLPLERVPSFMSFDAVMRRNGPKRKGQIPQIGITLEWSKAPSAEVTTNRYTLRKSILSGAAFVHRAEYGGEVEVEAEDKAGVGYRFLAPASVKDKSASFDRHFPSTKSAIFAQEFEQKQIWAGLYWPRLASTGCAVAERAFYDIVVFALSLNTSDPDYDFFDPKDKRKKGKASLGTSVAKLLRGHIGSSASRRSSPRMRLNG